VLKKDSLNRMHIYIYIYILPTFSKNLLLHFLLLKSFKSSANTVSDHAAVASGCGLSGEVAGAVPVRSTTFTHPCRPERLWAHPGSYQMRTGGSFSGVKRLGREADHSYETSTEVKKTWRLYIHSLIRPYGVVLN
jgi:hypothetical protein